MRESYLVKMEQIHKELLEMGMLCEQAIMKTYRLLLSVEERDELTASIDGLEREVDEKERVIESLCMQIFLKQQPVATDLRRVSAALKMITDLERIGDQAIDIAEIIETGSIKVPVKGVKLTEMAEFTMNMVNKCVESYVQRNLQMAQEVIQNDDVLDQMFVQARHDLGESMRSETLTSDAAMDLLMIAKYYERIGDHATNVAEWVEFSITGKHRNGDAVNDVFGKLQ